jgi:hypothetical protein
VRVAAGKTESVDIRSSPAGSPSSRRSSLRGVTGRHRVDRGQPRCCPRQAQLTLTNKELGYTSTQDVEIEPGEVKPINVEPRGTVNLNAVPWAEVWLNGQKLGDTPLAETPVPLGQLEFVFKHPQFGERPVSVTIKASANATVAVDFTK